MHGCACMLQACCCAVLCCAVLCVTVSRGGGCCICCFGGKRGGGGACQLSLVFVENLSSDISLIENVKYEIFPQALVNNVYNHVCGCGRGGGGCVHPYLSTYYHCTFVFLLCAVSDVFLPVTSDTSKTRSSVKKMVQSL